MKIFRKSRWFNKLYAFVFGYFWTSCPICGDYYGGHEWNGGILSVTYCTGRCVCYKSACIQEANRRNERCHKRDKDISPENCKDCRKEIMDCPVHSVSMPSP